MSLAPPSLNSPNKSDAVDFATGVRGVETRMVDGLDGPAELRRAPGGYWQVWPRPSEEALRDLYAASFYEEDKSTYLEDTERDRAYWDGTWSMRRTLMESALPASRRRILDVGCSGGFLLDYFGQHGWVGTGIEPSPKATEWAKAHFGLDVFCGDLLDYPPAPSPSGLESVLGESETSGFDAIHSAQVLEHVLDPEACLARISNLLAPGGVLYIEVPNDFNTFQEVARERLRKSSWWVAPKHHLNYFDYESLSDLLARHGLTEIDRLASFPIEMFLLMGEDFVGNPEVGSACHTRRMNFERSMIEAGQTGELMALYRSFAQASVGRTCGILARKDL